MWPHPQAGCAVPQRFWAGKCPISRELSFHLLELWITSEAVVASRWEADRQETKQDFLLCLIFSFTFSLLYGDVKARRKQTDFPSRIPHPLQRPVKSWPFTCLDSGIRQLNRADVERLLPPGFGSGCPPHTLCSIPNWPMLPSASGPVTS